MIKVFKCKFCSTIFDITHIDELYNKFYGSISIKNFHIMCYSGNYNKWNNCMNGCYYSFYDNNKDIDKYYDIIELKSDKLLKLLYK